MLIGVFGILLLKQALSASRPVDAFELVDVYLQHASGGALMVNGDKNLDAVTEWGE